MALNRVLGAVNRDNSKMFGASFLNLLVDLPACLRTSDCEFMLSGTRLQTDEVVMTFFLVGVRHDKDKDNTDMHLLIPCLELHRSPSRVAPVYQNGHTSLVECLRPQSRAFSACRRSCLNIIHRTRYASLGKAAGHNKWFAAPLAPVFCGKHYTSSPTTRASGAKGARPTIVYNAQKE